MKRITALILVVAMLGLIGCHAQVENGGKPIPNKVTSGEYEAEPEEIVYYKIDKKGADSLLAELSPIVKQMAAKTLTGDMVYLKKVISYLSQFNDYEDDLGKYMHAVEELCKSFYNFYVFNCTAKEVKEQIDSYFDTYYSLSDEFKDLYPPFEAADLYAVSAHIAVLVEEMLNPSEESEPPQSEAVQSETPPPAETTEPTQPAA